MKKSHSIRALALSLIVPALLLFFSSQANAQANFTWNGNSAAWQTAAE